MRSLQADANPPEGPESGKAKSEYRNYREGKLLDRVYNTYLQMHTHQTVDFVRKKSAEYGSCSLRKMGAMEALELLDQLVDESDPDVDFPNSYHAYQTAEGIRRAHPDKDWFHLVGLLHDLGKVLALFGEPQWAVVGDTFPVGCKVQKSVVFGDTTFHDNPDTRDPLYSTEYGMYQPRCGLENVLMSWGHDVHVQSHEGQPLRPAQGGILHGAVPLLLPLARARGLPAPLLRGGPPHAALGPRAQQVRPLHQAGGAARRAAAAGLLPVPHRQVLPRAALLVSGTPAPSGTPPPGLLHRTGTPTLSGTPHRDPRAEWDPHWDCCTAPGPPHCDPHTAAGPPHRDCCTALGPPQCTGTTRLHDNHHTGDPHTGTAALHRDPRTAQPRPNRGPPHCTMTAAPGTPAPRPLQWDPHPPHSTAIQ